MNTNTMTHLCLSVLLLMPLGLSYELRLNEYLRLSVITIGLCYIYRRWDGLAKVRIGRKSFSGVLLSVLSMFAITQFDPILGNLDVQVQQLGWFLLVSSALVGSAVAVAARAKYMARSEVSRPLWDGSDTIVVLIGCGTIMMLVAVGVEFRDSVTTAKTVYGTCKLLAYLGLWFLITRAYGIEGPAATSKTTQGLAAYFADGKPLLLLSVCVFGLAVIVGISQLGTSLLQFRRGEMALEAGSNELALQEYEAKLTTFASLDFWPQTYVEHLVYLYVQEGNTASYKRLKGLLDGNQRTLNLVRRTAGEEWYKRGLWHQAMVEFESLVVDGVGDDIVFRLGACYLAAGTYRPFRTLFGNFRILSSMPPRNAEEAYVLGNLHLARGEAEKAIKRFREGTELDPTDAGMYHKLGTAFLAAGRVEEALGGFQAAIDRDPAFAEALYYRGLCYE